MKLSKKPIGQQEEEKILIVDDDPGILTTLSFILDDAGYKVMTVETGSQAIAELRKQFYNLVLTDYQLPDTTGLELSKKVKEIDSEICIILITGHATLDSALGAIKENIYDYLIKPVHPNQLLIAIRKGIERQKLNSENERLLEELKKTNKILEKLSITDDLTGVFNQRYFYKKLKEELRRACRQNHSLSLLLFDIDHFKSYNDTYGHIEGDKVLKRLGDLILINIREHVDSGFRHGGDEFAVILPDTTEDVAKKIAERLRTAFEKCNFDQARLSIGITQYREKDKIEEVIKRADDALYKVKSLGGNGFHYAIPSKTA